MRTTREPSAGTPPADCASGLFWRCCDGMLVLDAKRRVLAMNATIEKWTGQSAAVVGSIRCDELLHCGAFSGPHPRGCPALALARRGRCVAASDCSAQFPGRGRRQLSASYTPIAPQSGDRAWTLVVLRDVTAERRRERRSAVNAQTDSLTGLLNRRGLLTRGRQQILKAIRARKPLAILMADLDGFKNLNDRHGHRYGDRVLQLMATALRAQFPRSVTTARFGGDEFVVVLPRTDSRDAMLAAEVLRARVARTLAATRGRSGTASQPGPVVGAVTASFGVASFPQDGRSMRALLSAADSRMYESKRAGKNCVVGPPHCPPGSPAK